MHCSGNLATQFATEFGIFVFLVTGNLVYKCQFVCRDGSQAGSRADSRVKDNLVRKIK